MCELKVSYIIRLSNGRMFSVYGSYEKAVKAAEEAVKGTEHTYVLN